MVCLHAHGMLKQRGPPPYPVGQWSTTLPVGQRGPPPYLWARVVHHPWATTQPEGQGFVFSGLCVLACSLPSLLVRLPVLADAAAITRTWQCQAFSPFADGRRGRLTGHAMGWGWWHTYTLASGLGLLPVVEWRGWRKGAGGRGWRGAVVCVSGLRAHKLRGGWVWGSRLPVVLTHVRATNCHEKTKPPQ